MSLARHCPYIGPEDPGPGPLTYRTNVWGIPTLFVTHGGAIEVCPLGEAVLTLDVWDYVKEQSTVQTEIEMRQACREWIRQVDEHDWLAHYCAGLVRCSCRTCRKRRRRQIWRKRTG